MRLKKLRDSHVSKNKRGMAGFFNFFSLTLNEIANAEFCELADSKLII